MTRPKGRLTESLQQGGMPLFVLGLGVVSLLLLILTSQLSGRLLVRDFAVVHSLGELQAEVAICHLWVEEYVSGDQIDLDEIERGLHRADDLIQTILSGGYLANGVRAKPLKNSLLRLRAQRLADRLDRFAQISRQRLDGFPRGEAVGIGSSVDRWYDSVFHELLDEAHQLDAGIQARLSDNRERANALFATILLSWGLIVGLAVTGLWNRERRRRQAVEALASSQAQLLQAQKMEAVGRLAGGVAHDINNYLAAITAHAEVTKMSAKPKGALDATMDPVITTAFRASALIRRLLAFSRREAARPRVIDLNRVVRSLETMLRKLVGEDVHLETRLEPELGKVRIDPRQLEQVIVNLVVNAREAMPTGGTLTIETRDAQPDRGFLDGQVPLPDEAQVLLKVSDTGAGIAPELREKIFEPFFSTKKRTGSSGLGLATIYGIAQQNDGRIVAGSSAGGGAALYFLLPRTEDVEDSQTTSVERVTEVRGRSERILLIEDNEDFRRSTEALLEGLGYRVFAAGSGEIALRQLEGGRERMDLVITDVVLPGMSGKDLAEAARDLQMGLPVLFVSGYTDDVVLRHGISEGEVDFLSKPYSAERLAAKIREILDRGEPAA